MVKAPGILAKEGGEAGESGEAASSKVQGPRLRERKRRGEREEEVLFVFFSLSFFDLDQLTTSFLSFPIQFYLKQQKQRERQQKYLKALAMESKPGPKTK